MRLAIACTILLAATGARAEHLPTIDDVFDTRAGLPTIDDAFPDAIRIGESQGDQELTFVRVTKGDVTWIELSLEPARGPRMFRHRPALIDVPIAMPPGVRVLGFELRRDLAPGVEPLVGWAEPIRAEHAAGSFADLHGPAVLSRTGASGGVEHLALRGVSQEHERTTIKIAIASPSPMHLAVLAAAPVAVGRALPGGHRIVLDLPGSLDPRTPPAVDDRHALVADLGRARNFPQVVFGGRPIVRGALDKQIIRREVRYHRGALQHCYEQRAMQRPGLAGTVELHFTILPSGEVEDVSADGLDDDGLRACVASEAARWHFPESGDVGAVIVNYPFTFETL